MTVDQEHEVDGIRIARPTLSGAQIERALPEHMSGYLTRLGAMSEYSARAWAWGAYETDGCQIGVAVLDQVTATCARGFVGVSPERRRLGIGTDLLTVLLEGAGSLGLAWLRGAHHAMTVEPRRLVRSMGLTAAWRVDRGLAMIAISVPPSSPRPMETTA